MINQLKAIHKDISHILNVNINSIRELIIKHNLSSAALECTLVNINLKQQLDKLQEIIKEQEIWENNKTTEVNQLELLKTFARFILRKSWEDLEVSGSDIEDEAKRLGLIKLSKRLDPPSYDGEEMDDYYVFTEILDETT